MNSAYLKDFTYGLAGRLLKRAVFDPDSALPTKRFVIATHCYKSIAVGGDRQQSATSRHQQSI